MGQLRANIGKTEEEQPGPDGGFGGWVAVGTYWTSNAVWTVFMKGLGIMLPALQEQFGTTTSIMGWIIAMIGTTAGLISPFTLLISRRFGTGVTIMLCGFMIGMAAVFGSLTSSAYQLALLLLVLAGTGFGIARVLTKAVVGQRFHKNYATAVGISKTSSSVGMILFAPLVQIFMDTYGWRGTLLLIGGISFHIIVCGALLVAVGKSVRHKNQYNRIKQDEHQSAPETNHRGSTLKEYVVDNMDLKILCNLRYWAVATVYCSNALSFEMWFIFFVSMALSKGFSPANAAVFVTVAGVGNLLSKLIQGFVVDRFFKLGNLNCIMVFISTSIFCATPWIDSYWLMMMSSFVLNFCLGSLTCLREVLAKQLLGADLLIACYGWIGIKVALLKLSIEFIPGWIYDISGSYDGAFIYIGIVQSVAFFPLITLRYLKIVE